MTDAVRVLVTAAALVALAIGSFAVRLLRQDSGSAARIVGELRLANAAALLLSVTASITIGFAIAARDVPASGLDAGLGVFFVVAAGVALIREPRESLLITSCAFALHALLDVAHRPGMLAPELMPRPYLVGCALLNLYLAAVCYLARRR